MSKGQQKIIYRFCFILAGFLLLQALIKSEAQFGGQQDPLDNITFYLAIIITGVGFVIRKGVKEKTIPQLGHDPIKDEESQSFIQDTEPEKPKAKVPKERSMRWFKFWTYWRLPAGVVLNACLVFVSLVWSRPLSFIYVMFSIAWAAFLWAVYKGLRMNRLWGWKMNFVVIFVEWIAMVAMSMNQAESTMMSQDISNAQAFAWTLWAAANALYFIKRKSFFTRAPSEDDSVK